MMANVAGKINYIALVFFTTCWIVFTLLLSLSTPNETAHLFKYLSQYITLTIIIIILFKDFTPLLFSRKYRTLTAKLKGIRGPKAGKLPKFLRIFPLKKKKSKNNTGTDTVYIEKEEAVSHNKSDEKSGLQEIKRPAEDTANTENKTASRRCFIYYSFYIILHSFNAWYFFNSIFSASVYFQGSTGGYLYIAVFILLAICSFLLKRFSLSHDDNNKNTTVGGYCACFGALLFAATLFFFIEIIFSLNYSSWLVLIIKISSIYLVISLYLNIFLSLLKKEGQKFSYQFYIPFINGKVYPIGHLLNIFEEYTSISIKSLWSMKYLFEIFPAFILSIAILLSLATCVYKIEPYQEGAVYRFGVLTDKSIKSPGLHIKYPWPIEKLEIYDTQRQKSLQIGYKTTATGDFLWAVPHEGEEYTLALGNGNELVAINAKVNYCIEDLFSYLRNYQNPESLLSDTAYEILTYKTVTKALNNFLMEDRTRLSEELKNELSLYCKNNRLGLEVKNVVIQSIHPAVEVAHIYQGVVGAGIEKQALITKAQAEAYKLIAKAEQDKEDSIMAAIQKQTERLSLAKHEMTVYQSAYDAYKINPASYKLDKYLETHEKIIAANKLYVFSTKAAINMDKYVINKGNKEEKQPLIIN